MNYQLLSDGPKRVYVVVFEKGDEAPAGLSEVAQREALDAAHLTAVGAFERAIVGWFDPERRDYRRIAVDEQVEVLSLVGDVTLRDEAEGNDRDAPRSVHCHVVLGRHDGSTVGGHLIEATVRPTPEVMLTETPARLGRRHDPTTGLALIAADRRPPDSTGVAR